MATVTAKLDDGFTLEIDDSFRDDYELVEAFADIEDGNITSMPRVIRRTLGAENTKALKEHLRTAEGSVSSVQMFDAFQQLITSTAIGKK